MVSISIKESTTRSMDVIPPGMKLMKKRISGSFQVVSVRIKKNRTCEGTTLLFFWGTTISSVMGATSSSFFTMALILTVLGVGRDSVIFAVNNGSLLAHFATITKRDTLGT